MVDSWADRIGLGSSGISVLDQEGQEIRRPSFYTLMYILIDTIYTSEYIATYGYDY